LRPISRKAKRANPRKSFNRAVPGCAWPRNNLINIRYKQKLFEKLLLYDKVNLSGLLTVIRTFIPGWKPLK
jgi:hypothetical protein